MISTRGDKKRLAIIAGDGIGAEIIAQGRKVLESIQAQTGFLVETVDFPYGAEYYLQHKIVLPNDFIEELQNRYDAVLIGTLGDKRVAGNQHVKELIAKLRYGLDLFLGLNRVIVYSNNYLPLQKAPEKQIDILLLREILESSQPRPGGALYSATEDEIACEVFMERAVTVRRFLRAALAIARQFEREKIVVVHKSNLYPNSFNLWNRILAEERQESGLNVEALHADLVIFELLNDPEKFDCLIVPGIFGETIYTPLLFLQGGYGFAYLCELNPGKFGAFRVTQSSAQNLVGRGFANPMGVFILLARLFEFWGHKTIAKAIEATICNLLDKRIVTIDLGGMMPTEEIGNYFAEYLSEELVRAGIAQRPNNFNQP